MNRLWVAALTLGCLIALVTSQTAPAVPVPDNSEITCKKYSNDNSPLNLGNLFDLVINEYINKIPMIGTEKVKEFMKHGDEDRDGLLSIAECKNLIAYLNTL